MGKYICVDRNYFVILCAVNTVLQSTFRFQPQRVGGDDEWAWLELGKPPIIVDGCVLSVGQQTRADVW